MKRGDGNLSLGIAADNRRMARAIALSLSSARMAETLRIALVTASALQLNKAGASTSEMASIPPCQSECTGSQRTLPSTGPLPSVSIRLFTRHRSSIAPPFTHPGI